MRKRSVRNGMRLVSAALLIIIIASFFLNNASDFFSFSSTAEMRFYELGIFGAAALGGYGVVLSALGLVLPARHADSSVRVLPTLFFIFSAVFLFFYLLTSSMNSPHDPTRDRLSPGETITI